MIAEEREEAACLYALGLLPPEEAREFEAAAAGDPELGGLVEGLRAGAAALACTAAPRDPPAALRGRILDRIREDEARLAGVLVPFPGIKAWLPWAAAACFAITTACVAYDRYHLHLLVDAFLLRDRLLQVEMDLEQTQHFAQERQVDALRDQVAALSARDALSQIKIATLASLLKESPQAMAVVAWDADAQRGILKTMNLPAAQSGRDYQLWIIDPGYKTPVSAGVFDAGVGGNFEPAHRIAKAGKFAVSIEKKGGSEAPEGPIVLVGE